MTAANGREPRTHLRDLDDVAVLGDRGEVQLGELAEAVQSAPVAAGVLTDEELHWATQEREARPRRHLDAPRLGLLGDRERRSALEATAYLLLARGELVAEESTEEMHLRGRLAVIGDLRSRPEAAVAVTVEGRDGSRQHAAIHRIRADLYLTEEVVDEGLHWFTLRSPDHQADWLAGVADPHGWAVEAGTPQVGRSTDAFDPHPDRLAERARLRTLIVAADGPPARSTTAFRGVVVAAAPEGVWVHGATSGDDDEAAAWLVQVDRQGLAALSHRLLSRPPHEVVARRAREWLFGKGRHSA